MMKYVYKLKIESQTRSYIHIEEDLENLEHEPVIEERYYIVDAAQILEEILSRVEKNKIESIVVIGTIIKRATFDEDGNELTPEQVIEGYHVDLLGHSLIQELKDYVPDTIPSNPAHGNGWCMGEKFIIVTKANYL